MKLPLVFKPAAVMLGVSLLCGSAYGQWSIGWTRQFSTPATYLSGVSATADGVYVVGYTGGSLPGFTNAGSFDIFVVKYDHNGKMLWTRQFGSPNPDYAAGISATADGVYVAGTAYGALPGQTQVGSEDAFVRKYDSHGNELWTRQFGSTAYDAAGGVSATTDGVYVVGETEGALPGQTKVGNFNAFVRKYDSHGNEVWTHQFGPDCGAPINTTNATSVNAAADGLYVAGYSSCALHAQTNSGSSDAFVRKYDFNGNEVWTREFGSSAEDEAYCVSAGVGAVYVGGRTSGALPGQTQTHMSMFDAFVRGYDLNGKELWTRQLGSSNSFPVSGLAAVANGVLVAWLAGISRYDSKGNVTGGPLFAALRPGAVNATTGTIYLTGGYLGNDASVSMLLPLSTTLPVITPQITGTLGNKGWYTSDVYVSWTVTDPAGIASSAGCSPTTLTTDTPGVLLTCSATDFGGRSASFPVRIKIDKTPPVISGMPAAGCTLEPPNGKLVTVGVVTAADALSGLKPGSFQLIGASNEPTGSNGPDIVITESVTGGFVIQLRAERLGKGNGRVYILRATATDLAGNTANALATCAVPHDPGK